MPVFPGFWEIIRVVEKEKNFLQKMREAFLYVILPEYSLLTG